MSRRRYDKGGVQPPLGGHYEPDDSTREVETRKEADGSYSAQVTAGVDTLAIVLAPITLLAGMLDRVETLARAINMRLGSMFADGYVPVREPGIYGTPLVVSGITIAVPCQLKRLVVNCTVAGTIDLQDGGASCMGVLPIGLGLQHVDVGATHRTNVGVVFGGAFAGTVTGIADAP